MSWIDNTANNTLSSENDYTKEFGYLDQASWALDFNLLKDPLYSEQWFYTTLARYIELMKTENKDNREIKIQEFINKIKNFPWSGKEKIKNYDILITKILLNWYSKKWDRFAKILQYRLDNSIDIIYEDYEWKINTSLVSIDVKSIPEWFYWRFTKSGLEERVVNRNREYFVESMRYQREKADELKQDL